MSYQAETCQDQPRSTEANGESRKSFCVLPWMHINAPSSGLGKICCEGDEYLKDEKGNSLSYQKVSGLHSYFNCEGYKKIRLQMLNGQRPSHCIHCFKQEDHGIKSRREQLNEQYKSHIDRLIKKTHLDGSIDDPQILYVGIALGNNCNIKCRMCSPYQSYHLAKDWKEMGKPFNAAYIKKIFQDKWYTSPKFLHLIDELLPSLRELYITGGEPMIIKGHIQLLERVIKRGHADHILIRYNSNQTVIPDRVQELWQHFRAVKFVCSVESHGPLNDYIRYPTRWKDQEKNIYLLDKIAHKNRRIQVFIYSTFQAYNVPKIPEFLDYLRYSEFKSLCRFPHFIWVKHPKWLSPHIFPSSFKEEIAHRILEKIDQHEEFFLADNKLARVHIQILRGFVEMMKEEPTSKEHFEQFIQETRSYDRLRNQSIVKVLPEVAPFFV